MEKSKFDQQLADLVWCMGTALRAGYSLRQVFEILADQAPEPAASGCGQARDDLNQGLSLSDALSKWQQATDSVYLPKIVATIQDQQQTGGNLASMLEPLVEEIFAEAGSDGAFYPAMEELAKSVGAQLPARVSV